jgi:heme/copper-type cytochrome/quinol oxidase subunit 4
MEKKRSSALRTTLMVLIALVALTAVEFWVSSLETPTVALLIISLVKASLILYYFMAIGDLWSGGEY